MIKDLSKEYFLANKEKILKTAIIAAVIVAAVVVFGFKGGNSESDVIPSESAAASEESAETPADEDKGIVIADVSGAVNDPRVVELKAGSRICDAIEEAGGLTAKADISSINRAAKVNDGDKIFIPEKGSGENGSVTNVSDQPSGGGSSSGTSISGGKVNINTASSSELQTLTGVGPAIAGRIIAYREQNGRFSKPEDIKNVSGIGDKTFAKMKDDISVQ